MSSQIAFRHIHKSFNSHWVVEAIDLTVEAGKVQMLVGPSGCGKSTLLNIAAGLAEADKGEVLVDGKRISGPGADRTVVFQDGALFPWLTAIQNVEFGLKNQVSSAKERTKRATKELEQLGLGAYKDYAIHQLSGGMRQRVAIARALVLEPKVLLMDEPFSALDAITREDLYVQLQMVWAERPTTVLFVTHNVREAVVLGDYVAIMTSRPGTIKANYSVNLGPGRKIDDVAVSTLAKVISLDLRSVPDADSGVESSTGEGNAI